MGYAFIVFAASIILMVHHFAITDAPRWSKLMVIVVVAASLAIQIYAPRWLVLATLLQSGIGVYMLMYLRWRGDAGS